MPPSLAVGLPQPDATLVATEVLKERTIPHNGQTLPSRGDAVIVCSVGGQVRLLSPDNDRLEKAAREKVGDEIFDELWALGEHHLAVGKVAECVPVGDAECRLTFESAVIIPSEGKRLSEPQAPEGLFLTGPGA